MHWRAAPSRGSVLPCSSVSISVNDLAAWLLDGGDPAIRWQVMRDLVGAADGDIASERARIAVEGAGAAILSRQDAGGTWAGVAWNRDGTSTMHALTLLRELGLDPACEEARHRAGAGAGDVAGQRAG